MKLSEFVPSADSVIAVDFVVLRANAVENCSNDLLLYAARLKQERDTLQQALLTQGMAASEKQLAIEILTKERDAERELRVMQLAAISTACLQNTERSIKDRIDSDNLHYSTAYNDVCSAINREMTLRGERDHFYKLLHDTVEQRDSLARQVEALQRKLEAAAK